jgi:hypothetical protein
MIQDNSIVLDDLRDGAAIRSSDIVDGQVNTADLANNAVTSDKIRDGEVKAEDLDPSIELGDGGSSDFSLQVTQRSNTIQTPREGVFSVSVQCNSDETVTGGGFSIDTSQWVGSLMLVLESRKQDNGWYVASYLIGTAITAYAECLKVIPANAGE